MGIRDCWAGTSAQHGTVNIFTSLGYSFEYTRHGWISGSVEGFLMNIVHASAPGGKRSVWVLVGVGGWSFRVLVVAGVSGGLVDGLGALLGFRRGDFAVRDEILEHLWKEEEDVVRDRVPDVAFRQGFPWWWEVPFFGWSWPDEGGVFENGPLSWVEV